MGGIWVPLLEVEGVFGGAFIGGGVYCLAVGEEAAVDGGAVLGGFTVAVEEVEFVIRFGGWHFSFELAFVDDEMNFTAACFISSFPF